MTFGEIKDAVKTAVVLGVHRARGWDDERTLATLADPAQSNVLSDDEVECVADAIEDVLISHGLIEVPAPAGPIGVAEGADAPPVPGDTPAPIDLPPVE